MKGLVFFGAFALLFLISSCSEGNKEISDSVNLYNIELIDNEKWKVEENMMGHIREMEHQLKAFNTEKGSYPALEEHLTEGLDKLTSSCVMTGQAHDELHKWLLPFIDLLDELKEKTEKSEKDQIYAKIVASMTEFNKYFK